MVMVDGGFRWADGLNEKALFIARTGFGYQVNSWLRAGGGVATTGAYTNSSFSKFELRPYQELFAGFKYRELGFQQRFRCEERFFKDVINRELQSGHNFNFRFRYQISASIPIVNLSTTKTDKKLLLSVSDEIFLNAGKEIVYNILDKNRIVVGPVFQHSASLAFGVAYLHQYSQLNSPGAYAQDDILWLTVRHSIDTRKEK